MPSVADLVEDHLLRALTDPETYEAGRSLADHGAVAFEQFGPMNVRGRVEDGDVYYVDLRVGPGKLAWSCSEPGASRGDFCRHCVAAAIETWRRAPARATGTAVGEADHAPPPLPPETPPVPAAPIAPATRPVPATERPAAALPPPIAAPGPRAGVLSGVHVIIFSPAADDVRAFFRDTLGLPSVDAGDGWPIFALPPAELAVHPAAAPGEALYLLCDDIDATVAELERRGIRSRTPIREEAWGLITEIALPGGTELPLYQPKHPRPGSA